MKRLEYELLRSNRPELRLPKYIYLGDEAKMRVERLNQEQLIASRVARIFVADLVDHDGFLIMNRDVYAF